MLRIPHCLDKRLIDGGKVVSDNKIAMISAYHSNAMRKDETKRQEERKSVSVLDYRQNVTGVDLKYQFHLIYLLDGYSCSPVGEWIRYMARINYV
jgi:hypothetical protein